MKRILFQVLRHIFIFIFALCFVQPAFAHGGEPRLEISVEQINPGGLVEVRGVDFDYEELVVLSLMRSSIQIPLSEVTTNVEGTFTQIVGLPADLPIGEYNFQARSDHHLVTSPTIIVWGVAVENQEDNSIRDQSDVQFGPLPTLVPVIPSTPPPQRTALKTPASKPNSTTLIYSIVVGVGIISLLGIRILKKR